MSLSTITTASRDEALLDRVCAAAQKEALNNPTLSDTDTGRALRNNPSSATTLFGWPVAVDYENEYASALAGNNENPGGDPSVISDANITAAVVAHWPDE